MLRDGSDAALYDFSVDAVEAAMIKAAKLIEKGKAATVLIQDEKGNSVQSINSMDKACPEGRKALCSNTPILPADQTKRTRSTRACAWRHQNEVLAVLYERSLITLAGERYAGPWGSASPCGFPLYGRSDRHLGLWI